MVLKRLGFGGGGLAIFGSKNSESVSLRPFESVVVDKKTF